VRCVDCPYGSSWCRRPSAPCAACERDRLLDTLAAETTRANQYRNALEEITNGCPVCGGKGTWTNRWHDDVLKKREFLCNHQPCIVARAALADQETTP
jgi:hypothetical protein